MTHLSPSLRTAGFRLESGLVTFIIILIRKIKRICIVPFFFRDVNRALLIQLQDTKRVKAALQ